jgi:hypothetical protein
MKVIEPCICSVTLSESTVMLLPRDSGKTDGQHVRRAYPASMRWTRERGLSKGRSHEALYQGEWHVDHLCYCEQLPASGEQSWAARTWPLTKVRDLLSRLRDVDPDASYYGRLPAPMQARLTERAP